MQKTNNNPTTIDEEYSTYLDQSGKVWWKRILDVQMPYRKHIRSLNPGYVLDVGCGTGRNLIHLNGNGIGIDHNPLSVEIANRQGLQCFTNQDFHKSKSYQMEGFDSILLSHVAEHMEEGQAVSLLKEYLPLLKHNGKVIIITPQEKGYKSDLTHVQFVDFMVVTRIFKSLNLKMEKQYSFPFPLFMGKYFTYNEFISIARKV